MSQRFELFLVFVVCVVLCGCGTQNGEAVGTADSNPSVSDPVPPDDTAATTDRLSEWVATTDDSEIVTQDVNTATPQAREGTDATIVSDDSDLDGDLGSDLDSDLDGDVEVNRFDDYFTRINDLVGGGDLAAAVEVAQEAYTELEDDPRATQLLISLSVHMVQKGDTDGALGVLEKLQETSDSQYIPPLLIQIYHLKSRKAADDATALAYIQKSTEILRGLDLDQPGIADIFFQEAILLGKNQQGEQALAPLREAFEKGYAEISEAEEAFADNEAALKLVQEFAAPIRLQLREEARTQIADSETFPFGFESTAVDDETIISTEELKGKVVIVDLWGTWCPPCREEIPHFVKLQENYGDDLAIVGVNFENGETEEEKKALVNEFIAANGVTYPCVLATDSLEQQVPNIEGFPTTIFMDKEGKVRLKIVGLHSYDKLDAIVRELIGDEPAA